MRNFINVAQSRRKRYKAFHLGIFLTLSQAVNSDLSPTLGTT